MTCLRAITLRRATTRWRRRGSAATGRAYLLHSVIFVIAALAVPAVAGADTVYLKNGRVIHTARARVENGMLVFSQLGGTVSIPMSAVERVERNTNVEPAAAAPPESAAAAGPEAASVPTGSRRASAAYPWDGAEYWGERLSEIDRRISRVENELDRLPAYSEVDQRVLLSRPDHVLRRRTCQVGGFPHQSGTPARRARTQRPQGRHRSGSFAQGATTLTLTGPHFFTGRCCANAMARDDGVAPDAKP